MADQLFEVKDGFEIDRDEAWRKIISRQFPGEAARGFGELIQNFLDSHPAGIAWEDRLGIIESGDQWISITDFGEGMNRQRLQLLLTLGGTDKRFEADKIGKFGIGFFAIFNPKLGTKRVVVTTKCEGETVRLIFKVDSPEKRPDIEAGVLEEPCKFSTKVMVEFDNPAAVRDCLRYTEKYLNYYPCRVLVNNQRFASIWEKDKRPDTVTFKKDQCHGMFDFSGLGSDGRIEILCKYEFIMTMTFSGFVTGGYNRRNDLRDFAEKRMPFIPGMHMVINSNNLNVTISRDSYYLDWAYHEMLKVVRDEMLKNLEGRLINDPDDQWVLANQYILRQEIKEFLAGRTNTAPAVEMLANYNVYPINGKKEKYSLADLYQRRSSGYPVFFAPCQTNLRWLNGRFKHDFIVLPDRCRCGGGAPDFYDAIFDTIFEDAVNLDTVSGDKKKVNHLINRGIIAAKDLVQRTEIVGRRQLTAAEQIFLSDVKELLNHEPIKQMIAQQLLFNVKEIETVLFDVVENGLVSVGLFDEQGNVFAEKPKRGLNHKKSPKIVLGFRRDHPLVEHLIRNPKKERVYYALIFLANQLVQCQKLLVPYSPLFHMIKERLAEEMRRVLMEELMTT